MFKSQCQCQWFLQCPNQCQCQCQCFSLALINANLMPIVFLPPYQCQFQSQCPMFWLNVNDNVNTSVNDLLLFREFSFKQACKLDWCIILLILVRIRGWIALEYRQNWQTLMWIHPINIEPEKGQYANVNFLKPKKSMSMPMAIVSISEKSMSMPMAMPLKRSMSMAGSILLLMSGVLHLPWGPLELQHTNFRFLAFCKISEVVQTMLIKWLQEIWHPF